MLATTRARLGLLGEQCLTLGGLALRPRRHDLPHGGGRRALPLPWERVRVRARRRRSSFSRARGGCGRAMRRRAEDEAAIAQICRWVEGMPLAILLASSWMELLSPGEIVAQMAGADGQRLDLLAADYQDLPERQRSMRAVFDHSWRLLARAGAGDARGARRSFQGRFTRGAAQEVAGASLRDLLRLVDRSLLQRGGGWPLWAARPVARVRRGKAGRAPEQGEAARDRHAAYYCRPGPEWQLQRTSPRQEAVLQEIEARLGQRAPGLAVGAGARAIGLLDPLVDVLRGASYSAIANGAEADSCSAPRWSACGRAACAASRAYVRAFANSWPVGRTWPRGRRKRARSTRCWEQCLRSARRSRARRRAGAHGARQCLRSLGDYDRALAEARRRATSGWKRLPAQFAGARCHFAAGRLEEARQLYERCLALWSEIGAPQRASRLSRMFLTEVALRQGRIAEAEERVRPMEALVSAVADRRTRVMRYAGLLNCAPRPGALCRGAGALCGGRAPLAGCGESQYGRARIWAGLGRA